MTALFKNVPVLDSGARGATTTFASRGIGDVLINWENEILLATKQMGDGFEMVTPSISIRAEPAVSVVDKNIDKHGSRAAAEAYLRFLYSDAGQATGAKHHYRPTAASSAEARLASDFPKVQLFTLDDSRGQLARGAKDALRRRRRVRSNLPATMRTRGVLPGFGLTMGYTSFYLGVLVLIPLSALFVKAGSMGTRGAVAGGDASAHARRLPADLRGVGAHARRSTP